MKEFKGTKGKWTVNHSGVVVREDTSKSIAIIGSPYDRDKHEVRNEGESWLDMYQRTKPIREEAEIEKASNAQLIAAAPELLEALINVFAHAKTIINKNHPDYKLAERAINKALGE